MQYLRCPANNYRSWFKRLRLWFHDHDSARIDGGEIGADLLEDIAYRNALRLLNLPENV
ncbi:MAG: hypothetical protein GX907_01340 [Clostridiaceae bacterium]|nr:hypothetical protein [Clostridiaceae bacterium]